MQEDKAPLFQAVDTLAACCEVVIQMLPAIRINEDAMSAAGRSGFLNATDMADYLVTKGMPFRESHGCVGRMVAHAISRRKELHELALEELRGFSPLIGEDIFDFLTTREVIDRRKSFGGTATEAVSAAIAEAERALAAAWEE
jgi:argininosuccinate lyase